MDADLYYKLLAFGDSKQKPTRNEYLKLSMVYKTLNDSVFLSTHNINPSGVIIFKTEDVPLSGKLGKAFMQMCEGDSMAFIVEATDVFSNFFHRSLPGFLTKNSLLKVEVKLQAILDEKALAEEIKKAEDLSMSWEVEEQRRIKHYLTNNNLNALQQPNGMYYISLAEGKGLKADTGLSVAIKYKGYFLDGQQFDATQENKPFEFTIGDEFQVIWGLQQGIKMMRAGGRAKFIIPSYLAYGEFGSSTGIVPPNTTVLYEVELINVNK